MSRTAIETFSTFGVGILCLVLGIMVLTLFFNFADRIGEKQEPKPDRLGIRGVLTKDTWAKIHMSGGEDFESVRLIGFVNTQNLKVHLPHDLDGMIILEDREQVRYLVRPRAIQKIVVQPAGHKDVANESVG